MFKQLGSRVVPGIFVMASLLGVSVANAADAERSANAM